MIKPLLSRAKHLKCLISDNSYNLPRGVGTIIIPILNLMTLCLERLSKSPYLYI